MYIYIHIDICVYIYIYVLHVFEHISNDNTRTHVYTSS